MSNQNASQIKGSALVMVIIWFNFVAAEFIYCIIAAMIDIPADPPDSPLMILVLGGVALGSMTAGFLLPSLMPERESKSVSDYMGAYQMKMIIRAALFESIGIYGLVLYFIGHPIKITWIFIAVSVLCLLSMAPGIFGAIDKAKMMEQQGR